MRAARSGGRPRYGRRSRTNHPRAALVLPHFTIDLHGEMVAFGRVWQGQPPVRGMSRKKVLVVLAGWVDAPFRGGSGGWVGGTSSAALGHRTGCGSPVAWPPNRGAPAGRPWPRNRWRPAGRPGPPNRPPCRRVRRLLFFREGQTRAEDDVNDENWSATNGRIASRPVAMLQGPHPAQS